MQSRGHIDTAPHLDWLGKFEGNADDIKAGEYRFENGITAARLLEQIVNGETLQYAITIVEGWSFRQLIDAVHSNEFLLHTLSDYSDKEMMEHIGHPGEHPEGRFLPDTYNFPRLTTDVKFLQRAYDSMQQLLEKEWPDRAIDVEFKTPYEALILASIVEKETALPSERKQIAGVFNRRLQKRMRLQTDPTVIYGLGSSYDGNIRRRDLRKDTPYNTYLRKGLPPTPIAMPGRDAVLAAMGERDVSCGIHYPGPLHLEEAYQSLGLTAGLFPAAEQCADEEVSLPMFPYLSDEQVAYVAATLAEIVG